MMKIEKGTLMNRMKVTIYHEFQMQIEGSYSPARPAPHCQDHDDPRFSDPGDPEEHEIHAGHFIIEEKCYDAKAEKWEKKTFKIPIPDALYEHLDDQIRDAMREEAISREEHAAEMAAEAKRENY